MIDLDGLEVHLKEIIDDGRGDECYTKAKNVMLLVERLRQAEKDAARYRWLRNEASMTDMQDFSFSLTSERDSFMDEAMKCEQ